MTLLAVILAAATDAPPDPNLLPPQPPPAARELPRAGTPPAIFTYTVDGVCRVDRTRKLQGPDHVSWRDAESELDVYAEDTVWRFVGGVRRQLQERRVRLLGEMVREGELVCHVTPAGAVVKAWIEREDTGAARRRALEREPISVSGGRIPSLGTFSLVVEIRR